MRRVAIVMLAGITAAVHLSPVHSLSLPLHYNISESLPKGLYRARWGPEIRRGDLIRVCLPEHVAHEARARGYLGPGTCEGDAAPIGKVVWGLPRDTVYIGPEGVLIGSESTVPAPVQERDTRGRPVPNALGTWVLDSDECLVLSTHSPQSYDSRYFGPIPCTPPFLVLTPLLKR